MDWAKLGARLRREALEYLADIRAIKDSLKQVEGWIALGLVVCVIIMTAVWFVTSLGFNPQNEHVIRLMYALGQRTCRPVSNFSGVVIFINLGLLILLAAMTLGNVFGMLERLRRGLPRAPRDLTISAALMLTVGIGGIIFMRAVC